MSLFFKKTTKQAEKVDFDNLPRHIAIILDGNGRWAQKRGLPRTAGHAAGAETFRNIATYCKEIGLDYLTVYAFSTENWKRPKNEVDSIIRLLDGVINKESSENESFNNNLLDYPVYTKPSNFRGLLVPEVLLSGDHKKIEEYRMQESIRLTKENRPDLLDK